MVASGSDRLATAIRMDHMGRSLRNAVEYARHGDLRVELVNRFRPGRLPKLLPRPISTSADCSPRRINRLLAAFPEPTRYLEIGVFQGSTLENVCATYRCGVEPRPKFDATKLPKGVTVHVCTSDEFFADLEPESGSADRSVQRSSGTARRSSPTPNRTL